MLKKCPVARLVAPPSSRTSWNVIGMKMSRHRSEEALTLTIAVLLVGVVAIGIIAGKLAKCGGAAKLGYALSVAGTSLRVSGAVPARLVVLDDVSRVPCGRVDSGMPNPALGSGMALGVRDLSCSLWYVRYRREHITCTPHVQAN